MHRTLAIIERELRRFRRSPVLIIMSLIFPMLQLIVLGYAFGGNVRNLTIAVVDQDGGVPAVKVRELAGAVAANANTFNTVQLPRRRQALDALRTGRVNGVLTIPPDYSRRVLAEREPRLAIIEDNTDNFVAATHGGVGRRPGRRPSTRQAERRADVHVNARSTSSRSIRTCRTSSTCCPDRSCMSIFMMVMIGGGIIFIDDKARGLHEGYLVTPITRLELIAGFNLSGTLKAVLAGMVLMTIGSLIAGVPDPFEPMRLMRLFVVIVITALALVSMMFLIMVRVSDPLMPRAIFGVLNTLLYFPSGAVYPQQAFPGWMKVIAAIDPFTYAVHAFKSLLLKNTGFGAISFDLGYLVIFSVVAMTSATLLFKRTL